MYSFCRYTGAGPALWDIFLSKAKSVIQNIFPVIGKNIPLEMEPEFLEYLDKILLEDLSSISPIK